jgi:L-seryl-tRNA(Ser) seleniumtransferase
MQWGGWGWAQRLLPVPAASAAAFARTRNLYEELEIRPIVNFRGTHTTIGASKQWPEVHEAMASASSQYVSLDELQEKVGARLSQLIGTQAAMVTTGAAGAIQLGTCACLTGNDVSKARRLPDLTGMKTEVIIQKIHRNGYDHAVRNTGVRIVEVESADELSRTVNANTAMMYFLGGTSGDYAWKTQPVGVEECLRILRKAGVPLLVDAANMLPPWGNLQKLAAAGVDLICVSGGKHMRGPQCSGILAGRKDLIEAAKINSSPHSDSFGRPLKVGREEMVGILLAAEKYSKLDFAAVDRECLRQAEYLRETIGRVKGVETGLTPSDLTRTIRRVYVTWDEKALGLTAAECEKQLWDGNPRIAVQRHQPQGILLTVFMNDAGEEKAAARRMVEILKGGRG